MAGEEGRGESGSGGGEGKSLVARWRDVVEGRWRKAGEHAEAYPYVWASYIVVYGGLGCFLAYKWRKFRKMEDRVRALQERARRLSDEQEATGPAANTMRSSGPSPLPRKPNGS